MLVNLGRARAKLGTWAFLANLAGPAYGTENRGFWKAAIFGVTEVGTSVGASRRRRLDFKIFKFGNRRRQLAPTVLPTSVTPKIAAFQKPRFSVPETYLAPVWPKLAIFKIANFGQNNRRPSAPAGADWRPHPNAPKIVAFQKPRFSVPQADSANFG